MPESRFIQTMLPLRLGWEPLYIAGPEIHVGQRVKVIFAHREYIAVVHRTDVIPDMDSSRIQHIVGPAEGFPDISEAEIRLWEFTSSYYMCTIGEVYKAAYPVQKVESEASALSREASRLREKLARIDSELEKRSASSRASAKVTQRLADERDGILARLKAMKETPEPAMVPDNGNGEGKPAPAGKPTRPSKPEVFIGSRRTDFYINRIRQCCKNGGTVLVLAPDIIFAEKLYEELSPVFPDILEYSSKKTAAARKRVSEYVRERDGIVIGTRSAIFLPYRRLSLVIIDNEQDSSFKQDEPAPRYNARDLAVILANIHGASTVIGTDMPSLETVVNCRTGKYVIVKNEPGRIPMPPEIIDINAERRKNGMLGLFSRKLLEAAANTEGAICLIRGWEKTEELEAQAGELLPGRNVSVMTLNEAKRKGLGGFGLVAAIQADAFISRDDFRSDERAIQALRTLIELSDCATVIQTANASHRIYSSLSGSYNNVVEEMLSERKDFGMPPFTRITDIIFNDGNEARLLKLSSELARILSREFKVSGIMNSRIRIVTERDRNLASKKTALEKAVLKFETERNYAGHIHMDVDPN